MKINPSAFLAVVPAFLPYVPAQGTSLCEQCSDAAACFGSGPCAACDASAECTGLCEGCATAGPCRACFETGNEVEELPVSWPVQVPQLPCDYSVDKVNAKIVSGEIPSWLEGTLYHAQHTNSSHMEYDGNLANPSGVLAITFGQGEAPITSFDMPKGTGWQTACQETGPVPPYISDCVVTINQFGGTPETIASVCADSGNVAQFVTDDSGGISTDGALDFIWSDPNLTDTFPYGSECTGFCPTNLQPEHMAIDANGDVYSLFFTTDPAGYRVFNIPRGTTERVQIAWVESDKESPSYLHAGPIPTSNYIVLIEPPLENDFSYDWAQYQQNFDPNGEVTVYVLDKNGGSGEVIAKYIADSTFWTWHVANAWEDCDTGEVVVDLTLDPNAASFQSFYNSTTGNFGDTSLARLTLPNPQTAGFSAVAATTILDTAGFGIEFPVSQDQYQFAGKTGHYWMAGSKIGNPDAFPLSMTHIIKFDVEFFVARERDQGPMSDDGVVVTVGINVTGHMFGAVLDAMDLAELAIFEIPMAPVQNFGLHNFYSTSSTWLAPHTECTADINTATDEPDSSSSSVTGFTVVSAALILAFVSGLVL